jgi:hypothetical protein
LRNHLFSAAFLLLSSAGIAQTVQQSSADPDLPSVLAVTPRPGALAAQLRKVNAGVSLTSVHDSADGWYTLVTPALTYTLSRRYSIDLSMPVYLYRLAESEVTTVTQPPTPPGRPGPPPPVRTTTVSELTPHKFDPGDVFLAGHISFPSRHVTETVTPSLTLPSGDSGDGLSTGRVTFDVDSHSAFWLPRSAVLLDLGGGDSTSLFNRMVTRDYTSLGYIAHFQLGLMASLPHRSTFQSVAYEQLPLGDSKIYTTLTRPGYPSVTVVSGRSVSEDNGFTSTLSMPMTHHLTLQGFYNRSLRLHLDTVGMGITFVARGYTPRKERPSFYDQLLKQ